MAEVEEHLDDHFEDFDQMFPCVGKVTGVYARDDAQNVHTGMTLYQVTLYMQKPSLEVVLDQVPAKGQYGAGVMRDEDPYSVDQWVLVGFVEGDIERPYIDDVWPNFEEAAGETSAQHPIVSIKRNGCTWTTSKTGNHEFKMAADSSYTIKDTDDNAILKIVATGGSFEIHLGGDTGTTAMVLEAVKDLILGHTHPGSGAAPTAVVPPLNPALWLPAYATTKTKGK